MSRLTQQPRTLTPPAHPRPPPPCPRRKIRDDSNCLTVALRPGLLDVLRRHATTLDIVRAQLDQYLELKRTQFPRFYFLSNDELIEILATAGVDPRAVQARQRRGLR